MKRKIRVKMVESGETKPHFHYALSSGFLQVFFVTTNLSPDEENRMNCGNTRAKYLVLIPQDELGASIPVIQ